MKLRGFAIILFVSLSLISGCSRFGGLDDPPAAEFGDQPTNVDDQVLTEGEMPPNYDYQSMPGYDDGQSTMTHERHSVGGGGAPAEVPFDDTRKPQSMGNVGAL